jgi:hypothetical protein
MVVDPLAQPLQRSRPRETGKRLRDGRHRNPAEILKAPDPLPTPFDAVSDHFRGLPRARRFRALLHVSDCASRRYICQVFKHKNLT